MRTRSRRPARSSSVRNCSIGSSNHAGGRRPRTAGLNVPQWIGTTSSRVEDAHRLRSAAGIEVALAERRPPPPDRQQGNVDRRQVGHLGEQVGVAGEVHHQARTAHDVADGRGADPAVWTAPVLVHGSHGLDADATDRGGLADSCFADVAEAAASHEVTGALGHDQRGRPGQPPQRRQVQVVEVHMGDQHGIDRSGDVVGDGAVAAEVRHAIGEHRVGQQPDATEIEHDGRVAHPRELDLGLRRHRRRAYGAVAATALVRCVRYRVVAIP